MAQSTPVIVCTPNTSLAYVGLAVTGLTGSDTYTINRTHPDGTVHPVRGALNTSTGAIDSAAVTDYECPLGAAVTYQVTAYAYTGQTLTPTTSLTASGTNVIGNMTDGNISTFFLSTAAPVTNDYIKIDLGGTRAIQNISINQDAAGFINSAALEYSTDNVNWSFFAVFFSNLINVAGNFSARYLRLRATANNPTTLKVYEWAVTSGSVSTVNSLAVAATIATVPGTSWLKDLATPGNSVGGLSAINKVSDVKRAGRVQVNNVIGRQNPVVISDVRQGRTGSISLICDAPTNLKAVLAVLNTGAPILFQVTSSDNFPDMYLVPGDVTENRPSDLSTDTTRIVSFDYTEVDAPTGIFTSIPGNSYALVVNFGSYTSVQSSRTTYLDLLQRPYGS